MGLDDIQEETESLIRENQELKDQIKEMSMSDRNKDGMIFFLKEMIERLLEVKK